MRSGEKLKQTLSKHIECDDYKMFFIYTSEELRALEIIKTLSEEKETNLYIFDIAEGFRSETDPRVKLLPKEYLKDLLFTLKWLEVNGKGFVVFLHITPLLENDPVLTRAFKNLVNAINTQSLYLKSFILSTSSKIPDELLLDSFFVDLDLPTREEIESILDSVSKSLHLVLPKTLKEEFINALQGLREIDIINMLKHSLYDGELRDDDIESIIQLKKQLLRKESLLEFVSTSEGLGSVGGMKNLKEWLRRKGAIIKNLDEALSYGVNIPKGILLFGMPGCGKSLVSKTIAYEWKLPLLRLDMGLILGPYVGQSEENIRRAIKIAESIAPCILWIDELEKGFSGISGEGGASDVMRRVFGSFLTWMQEKTKPVFVVATANDIGQMPPEFLRKGRFDEIFFVDFPNPEARLEILKIHLKKRRKDEWFDALSEFNNKMDGFSGADIEAFVTELVERAFLSGLENQPFDLKKEAEEVLSEFQPLSKTMKGKIEELKKKFKEINARPAD